MNIRTVDELKHHVNGGKPVKYLFFWGHQSSGAGVSKSCFSQWYDSAFSEGGVTYMTAEHYMMAAKARLFNDYSTLQKIIGAHNPGEVKALGREVKGFDESVWVQNRFDIVVRGNCLKFSQNTALKNFLINTGDRVLVEASPVDRVWGIGLAADNKQVENPNLWRGPNLLGFALMAVRRTLTDADK